MKDENLKTLEVFGQPSFSKSTMRRLFLFAVLMTSVFQYSNCQPNLTTTTINITSFSLVQRCVWTKCNVPGFPSLFFNYSLECCMLQVPLNYARPNRSISISLSRLTPPKLANGTNTLAILMGGPGGTAWAVLEAIVQLIPATYGIILIIPDHRGTGLSSPLSCDDTGSQNVTVDCISYLTTKWSVEGLNQFSTTAAAHDLAVQIQSYQAEYTGRISIYGMSYGTFWLDRFLQIYPTLVQSAIMDGVVNHLMSSISRYEMQSSITGSQFLSYCQLQPECNQYFPANQPPDVMLRNILFDIDSNNQKCIKNNLTLFQITSDKLRNLLFELIQSSERYMDRTVVPAVIYRLNRCNTEDVTVLNFFFRTVLQTIQSTRNELNSPDFAFSSLALQYNIVQSEMWLNLNESEIDKETIFAWHQSAIVAPNILEQYITLRPQWPKYSLDQYRYKVASYSPLLMISGQLDLATPFDQVSQLAAVTAKTSTFYGVPLTGHVTMSVAHVGYFCPLHLICSWAFPDLFPVEWSDPKCLGDLPTIIDFVGDTEIGRQYSRKLLNISRPFGNDSSHSIRL